MDKNACPVARALDVIGDWWSLLIIRNASLGMCRFGEFQKSLGMAKNILSARLRLLVEHGLLEARPAADGGAHREYVLTDKGSGLFPVLVALRQWGEDYLFADDCPGTVLVDRAHGRKVARLEVRAMDGRVLAQEDAAVRPIGGQPAGASQIDADVNNI
jgi:DNA-binding HxlR family transcriptional regulator